jgi:thioredoxin-like negative regulator of GroEL
MVIERLLIMVVVLLVLATSAIAWRLLRAHQMGAIDTGEEGATGLPALLYFWSENCAPCRFQQAPIVERLAEELAGRIAIRKVDAVAEPALAARYGILSVPTTVVITSHGQVVARNTGVASAETLYQQLEAAGR